MSRKNAEDSSPRLGGIDYSKVMDRQVGDKRFERERQGAVAAPSKSVSSTFDAFQRMAAGLDGRTIADKISDPNRPTWEQYKKENEEKLDFVGDDVRKMVEYREQLDRERERRLREAGGRHRGPLVSDSDSESDDESHTSSSDDSSGNSDSDSDSDDDEGRQRKKRRKDSNKKSNKKHSKKHKKDKKSKKNKKEKKSDKHPKKDSKHHRKRQRQSNSSDEGSERDHSDKV